MLASLKIKANCTSIVEVVGPEVKFLKSGTVAVLSILRWSHALLNYVEKLLSQIASAERLVPHSDGHSLSHMLHLQANIVIVLLKNVNQLV